MSVARASAEAQKASELANNLQRIKVGRVSLKPPVSPEYLHWLLMKTYSRMDLNYITWVIRNALSIAIEPFKDSIQQTNTKINKSNELLFKSNTDSNIESMSYENNCSK